METFKTKFKVEEFLVARVGGWNISVREQQPTLGSLVLSLDRDCSNLGELSKEESEALGRAMRLIDALFQATLKPEKVNYLALMMVDEHVHFHVLPRFSAAVDFAGEQYIDHCWPKPHTLEPLANIDEQKLQELTALFMQQVPKRDK